MTQAYNPSTQEAEAGGSLWVQSQPRLQSEFQDNQGYTEKPWLKKRSHAFLNNPENWADLTHLCGCGHVCYCAGEGISGKENRESHLRANISSISSVGLKVYPPFQRCSLCQVSDVLMECQVSTQARDTILLIRRSLFWLCFFSVVSAVALTLWLKF